MIVSFEVPDDLSEQLGGDKAALARKALEAFAVEWARSGRVTRKELARLLNTLSAEELDSFITRHGINVPSERPSPEEIIEQFRAFRDRDLTLGEIDPVELIREGRR